MNLKEQYEKLLRYCYMKTGDRYIAEDIVQETYIRFWNSRNYEDMGKEMAYLYTIARNLCMDEFRRPQNLNIDDYSTLQSDDKSGQGNAICKIDIEKAMESIPEELREIVTLRYVSDMSSADIGKMLGLLRFAVHRRLKMGLAMLRETLEEGECSEG